MTRAQILSQGTSSSPRLDKASDTGQIFHIPAGGSGADAFLLDGPWQFKNATFDVAIGGKYLVDTQGSSFAVTLPIGMVFGDEVVFRDANFGWSETAALNINPAASGFGSLINGAPGPFGCNAVGATVTVTALNETTGVAITA